MRLRARVRRAARGGLKRFRIRVKVEIEDRSADVAAAALRGRDAIELHARCSSPPARSRCASTGAASRASTSSASRAAIDAVAAELGARRRDRDRRRRVRSARASRPAFPRQGFDIDETTIPQEAFLERDAVSFTKGCFLGQELVCRIDTRGHVNRFLRRLRADAPIERGATVVADGKVVGTVTSAVGTVALGDAPAPGRAREPSRVGPAPSRRTVEAVPQTRLRLTTELDLARCCLYSRPAMASLRRCGARSLASALPRHRAAHACWQSPISRAPYLLVPRPVLRRRGQSSTSRT